MIAYLKGVLVSKSMQNAIIEVNGVGYNVGMPGSSLQSIGDVGCEVTAYISMQVREDAVALYGFATEEERFIFEKIKTVSGIGPKVALNALSTFTAQQLISAIAAEDAATIAKIPNVGKKTAQRLIVDLKGVFESAVPSGGLLAQEISGASVGGDAATADAKAALLSMGFSSEEADVALSGYDGAQNTEDIIRYALKRIGF